MLFRKAEEIAASMGEDTVYNFVHPNNEGMIRFLASKGYTVLNMIEVRKPYKGEKLTTTISPNVPQQNQKFRPAA
jgi:ribosomal protein S18 acetylase RimI-like enzyme